MTTTAVDEAKLEAFMEKILGDLSGTMATLLGFFGDRLGLFNDLAERGPATSDELAGRLGLDERYVREWLGGMAAAGYLEYEGDAGRFSLPPEHAQALAQEGGPHFVGGVYQMVPAVAQTTEKLAAAFRTGGGVSQAEYGPDTWAGMERFSAGWFENLLLQEWIPGCPDAKAKLEHGCAYADVGCGSARALIKLAQAFPKSRFVGYDIFEGQLERARANVQRAGLEDRVELKLLDVVGGLPEQSDVISTYDVVHDAANPRALLRAIRDGLKPDGVYLLLEINCADTLEGNIGPLGAMFYGFSVFYCMTTSLASGGEGLGTLGLPESRVRELCAEAGFGSVRRVPLENPFNVLYEVRP